MLQVQSRTPVLAGFTDRTGGVAPAPYDSLTLAVPATPVRGDADWPGVVAQNLTLLAASLPEASGRPGAAPPALALMHQVHGADVVVVDDAYDAASLHSGDGPGAAPEHLPAADALVTTRRDVALVVRVADCVPVLLADPVAGVVAAVHAGRAGVAADVVGAAVAAARGLGATDLQAWVGPSICGACYEVPAAMADDVAGRVPAARAVTRDGTPGLDLPAAVRSQLEAAGVGAVVDASRCTREDPALFSHRRDAAASGRTAGVVWLPPSPGARP